MAALVEACPSFRSIWQKHAGHPSHSELAEGVYVDVGMFADHLVTLANEGETAEFPAVFDAVEKLLADSDEGVRYATKIGLLEAVGNVGANRYGWTFANSIAQWMGPRATQAWAELHAQWGSPPGR